MQQDGDKRTTVQFCQGDGKFEAGLECKTCGVPSPPGLDS